MPWFAMPFGNVPWKLPYPLSHTRKRVGFVAKRVGEPACARAMETTERQQQSADSARARGFMGRIANAKGSSRIHVRFTESDSLFSFGSLDEVVKCGFTGM